MEETSERSILGRHQSCSKFYQTRSNAIILHETVPAYCVPKFVGMETGKVMYEKVYMSPRSPPKISLKHDWKRELVSEHAQRPEGQVVQQSRSVQSNQPIPNPISDRKGQPIVGTNTRTPQDGSKTLLSQEIDTCSFHEEPVKTDSTGQPVVETGRNQTRSSDDSKSFNVEMAHVERGNPLLKHTHTDNVPDGSQTRSFHESMSFNVGDETIRDRTVQPVVNHDESSHEQTMLNEVNMDFRIPGLPHCVVKQAETSRVRELVKKIENHPGRHALQQDLRQNKAYNPFSAESKRMIQDLDDVELFELFETDPLLRDHVFRERMIENNRDEEVCRAWDVVAEQDHTYHMSEEEYFHYRRNWWISLNKSENDTRPVRKRSDFNQALSTPNRSHQEAGGQLGPMPCWKYKEWKPASSSSSTSSTWWHWRESWWSS